MSACNQRILLNFLEIAPHLSLHILSFFMCQDKTYIMTKIKIFLHFFLFVLLFQIDREVQSLSSEAINIHSSIFALTSAIVALWISIQSHQSVIMKDQPFF